jgi:DNA-binding response OmpR family regulator
MGVRNIESVSTLRDFARVLKTRPPDLALCDAQGGEEVCGIIQALRQEPDSPNPFVIVLVMAWSINADLMNSFSNAGVDGLILRPFSTSALRKRIAALTSSRKRFVVTSEYVGPDRREGQSRPSDAVLLDAPNSLMIKTDWRSEPTAAARKVHTELHAARAKLDLQKLKSDSIRLCILGRLLQDATEGDTQHKEMLDQMTALINGIERRGRKTYPDLFGCLQSLQQVVSQLRGGDEYDSCLATFQQQTTELARMFQPEKAVDQLLNELLATVTIVRARQNLKVTPIRTEYLVSAE